MLSLPSSSYVHLSDYLFLSAAELSYSYQFYNLPFYIHLIYVTDPTKSEVFKNQHSGLFVCTLAGWYRT